MSDVWTIELEKEEPAITAELAQQSGESYTLPMAGPDVLGGVKPAQKTNEMTKRVGIDENGRLWSEKESEQVIEEVIGKYLQNNPIIPEETDPTVPEWAKQPNKPVYTAAEVGALPADTVIPDGGIPIPNTASVGQTVVVKAVDKNGKPIEWEAADFPAGGEAKTKIITITDVTFENDLVISADDTDDINFGDAVVNHRHYFYLTPEGEQIKAKRIYGYIQPSAEIKRPASLLMSPYYRDGTPTTWGYGDFLGNNLGVIGFFSSTYTCGAGSYLSFEANLNPLFARSGVSQSPSWEKMLFNGTAFTSIDAIIPHFSGVKLSVTSGSFVLPAGTRFVLKAEVEDNA